MAVGVAALRVLEAAGLVSSRRRGGNIIYSLQTSVLQDIVSEFADMAGVGRQSATRAGPARSRPRPQGA